MANVDRAANVLRNRGWSGGRAVDLGLDRCLSCGLFLLAVDSRFERFRGGVCKESRRSSQRLQIRFPWAASLTF